MEQLLMVFRGNFFLEFYSGFFDGSFEVKNLFE